MRVSSCVLWAALTFPLAVFPAAAQNCGWSHVDHLVSYDASGVWNPNVYRGIVGGADDRRGRRCAVGRLRIAVRQDDVAGDRFGDHRRPVGAQAGKYIFTRVRPDHAEQSLPVVPGRASNHSFPSGEASVAAALVTPYVLEYGSDNPATYALLLLPLYVGAARVKNQAHWQTDVLAGWAVGGLSGWYAHSRDVPIMIEILPHGFAIGFKTQF